MGYRPLHAQPGLFVALAFPQTHIIHPEDILQHRAVNYATMTSF